jgi:hypothetical protein
MRTRRYCFERPQTASMNTTPHIGRCIKGRSRFASSSPQDVCCSAGEAVAVGALFVRARSAQNFGPRSRHRIRPSHRRVPCAWQYARLRSRPSSASKHRRPVRDSLHRPAMFCAGRPRALPPDRKAPSQPMRCQVPPRTNAHQKSPSTKNRGTATQSGIRNTLASRP